MWAHLEAHYLKELEDVNNNMTQMASLLWAQSKEETSS
jgi:hypothetical protein